MTPWAGNGRRPATPHPPGDAVPSMEHLRAPRLTSHTSLFPSECVSVTGPVQTLAGTAGMPAAAWGSAGLSWVSHGCPRCPSAPALIPGVGCSPKPLQKLRLMVGDAALGPWAAPRVHCKPVARLQAAGLGPAGLELLASLEASGLGVAWLLPNQGCHGQSGCLGHSTVGPTHRRQRWGPSFLGTSFSRVLATGPTWEPAPETQFLRSSTQPQAAQRRELLLFTAWLSRAGRHPLPDWARVGGDGYGLGAAHGLSMAQGGGWGLAVRLPPSRQTVGSARRKVEGVLAAPECWADVC